MKTLVKMNFNPEIAGDIGERAAIILENIAYWIDKNAKNQINKEEKPSFKDGRWWTYNSVDAFQNQFYWLTSDQIRTSLEKLEEKDYIKTGNYNKVKYDRTKWYALGDNPLLNSYKSIWDFSQIELGEHPNRISESPKPIPNNNTNYNTDLLSNNRLEEKEVEVVGWKDVVEAVQLIEKYRIDK